jgi:hypothetical protein
MARFGMFVQTFGPMLLGRVPTILVLLVGIILSFVFWSRKPRQSVWVMLASVIALANIVSYDVVWAILWSRGAAASHRDGMELPDRRGGVVWLLFRRRLERTRS